jgi:hypothetical protein
LIYRARIVQWQELNLWQKILLILTLAGAVVLAAVVGLFILYVAAVIIAFGFIAYGVYMIWQKFFAPKPKRRGRVRVRRTKDGVVIDGDFEEE